MDAEVAVVGGGVVGVALALAVARRGAATVLLEAETALGLAASGTNSGVLHTGFDSRPGELETVLILRAAALRDPVLDALGLPVLRCGARLRPASAEQRETVAALARNAAANGVAVTVEDADGTLLVPGESVTDPVAYVHALAGAAHRAGARIETGARVTGIARDGDRLIVTAGHLAVRARVVVNAAGLHADTVARLAGDASFGIRPRKGEFLVFDVAPPERILLPVPTARTKGVLVFPTLDGRTVAGPTAVDLDDKGDWTVRAHARDELQAKAAVMHPPLAAADPVAAYAGLRPAGRDGENYVIGPSAACRGLVHAAAIRSTGLTASLGIAEHVCGLVTEAGVALGDEAPLVPGPPAADGAPADAWWRRTARHVAG